jgi:hypothetical protein
MSPARFAGQTNMVTAVSPGETPTLMTEAAVPPSLVYILETLPAQ